MPRVSTYLNFSEKTEEAFNFYKSVFGGEFGNDGIARFGDMPPHEGRPPLSEKEKNLILHIELPILGGHVLMGSDAPQSMGFEINFGNNIYLNLEPDTRAETKKLFDALSKGGKVTMELQDMFWGAYYGSCTDSYGVHWMFNCIEKQNNTNLNPTITVEILVNAPINTVWNAWTNPNDIIKWNAASDDWHTTKAELDLTANGNFLYRMEAKDGSVGFDFTGTFNKIEKNKEISYTLTGGRKVAILFLEKDNATFISQTFDPEDINSFELQRFGWQCILNNFKTHVEGK